MVTTCPGCPGKEAVNRVSVFRVHGDLCRFPERCYYRWDVPPVTELSGQKFRSQSTESSVATVLYGIVSGEECSDGLRNLISTCVFVGR